MTNDFKEKLLKYLTGNIEETPESTTPFYKDYTYTTRHDENFTGGNNVIKCVDSNGNYNGKCLAFYTTILNGSDYYIPNIMLIDENMNIIHSYSSFSTGTRFNCFMGLETDETGKIYGIDYDPLTQKYRFILMNNLSEPTKMPDGSYEYRAVLRNSYFIQGYTEADDISYTRKVILGKSRTSAKYYFAFQDTTGQTIMPSTLEINVGETNTWERLQDITILNGELLDNYIIFNSDETPIARYYYSEFIYNGNSTEDEKITKATASGNGTPVYETFLASIKYLYDNVGDSFPKIQMVVKTDNWYFLILYGLYADNQYKQRVRILEFKNNTMTKVFEDNNSTTISTNTRLPYVNVVEQDGAIYMYYGFQKEATEHSNNKLYFTITNTDILEKGINFNIDTNTETYDEITTPFILNTKYYLKKACLINPLGGDEIGLCVSSVMYGSGVDGEPNNSISAINPSKGVLYDSNNKMLFARGLYNKKVYNNKTTCILNVPNNSLNEVNINTGALLGYTNYTLIDNSLNIVKNIYEDLYINYFITMLMQNQNTTNYIDNYSGASRINSSTCKDLDYENAKATKMRVNYEDGTNFVGGISATITNNIATYKMTIYVPEDKKISSIDILSNDGNTVYQEIKEGLESLENDKYYNIYQDVYVS